MENLIIIGNGFDLAHGLKTRYSDFFSDLNSKIRENPGEFKDLVYTGINKKTNRVELIAKQNSNIGSSHFKNKLIQLISKKIRAGVHWSDLEYLYFQILMNYNDDSFFKREFGVDFKYNYANELNKDFEQLKKYLEIYLTEEEKNLSTINVYNKFFEAFRKEDTTIVNFNYTNTVKEYIKNFKEFNLIHIHGELNNDKNPIIFGFAANDKESKLLLDKDDNELMYNIKKINYKLTENDNKLKEIMDDTLSFDVFILGHSCGISDKLILNQILNHKKLSSIRIFYFQGSFGYRETAINIDRIIDDYSKNDNEEKAFLKLKNFPQCFPVPQNDWDNEKTNRFAEYINNVIKKQRMDFQTRHSATIFL